MFEMYAPNILWIVVQRLPPSVPLNIFQSMRRFVAECVFKSVYCDAFIMYINSKINEIWFFIVVFVSLLTKSSLKNYSLFDLIAMATSTFSSTRHWFDFLSHLHIFFFKFQMVFFHQFNGKKKLKGITIMKCFWFYH